MCLWLFREICAISVVTHHDMKNSIVVTCKQGIVLQAIKCWYLHCDLVGFFLCSIVVQLLKGVKLGRVRKYACENSV